MTVNKKPTGRATSIPVGLAWGEAFAVSGLLIGTTIIAKLIDTEKINWNASGYAIMIILLLSAWSGSIVAGKKIKRLHVAVGLYVGVIYFITLMAMTALFFGGKYSGVGETAGLILCGSMLGTIRPQSNKSIRNFRKHKIWNR